MAMRSKLWVPALIASLGLWASGVHSQTPTPTPTQVPATVPAPAPAPAPPPAAVGAGTQSGQNAPVKPAPQGSQEPAKPITVPDCTVPGSKAQIAKPTTKLYLDFATNRIWTPSDGKIQFKIVAPDATTPATLDDLQLAVCFGWPKKWVPHPENSDDAVATAPDPPMIQSYDVRVVKRDGNKTVIYEVSLPRALWDDGNGTGTSDAADFWRDWSSFLQGRPYSRYNGWGVVPIVNLRVVAQAKDDGSRLDSVLPVGITYHVLALVISLLCVVVFWLALLTWGKARNVRGDVILKIIANRNNYASLSQLQILLWTVVIGAGAIYVMAITGGLIDVPQQALILLGITGASALTAAVAPPKDASTVAATAAAPVNVGVVTNLRQLSATTTSVVLLWEPPAGGRPVSSYVVSQWNSTAVPPAWVAAATAPGAAGDPFAVVTGLQAGQTYRFQIAACDVNGVAGAPSEVTAETKRAAAGPPPQAAQSLTAKVDDSVPSVTLTWRNATSPNPDAWIVQYRVSGTGAWITWNATVNAAPTACTLGGLKYATAYDFQIAPVANGAIGPWSAATSVRTGMRMPKWSDLVIWDGIKEVDITRVQMLAFTVLAAAFVLLKIGTEGDIPEIPSGIVTLIGLSNGVYVGAKFIGGQK